MFSSMFGDPATQAGQIVIAAGGAFRAPPSGGSMWPAGAAGNPKIGEAKVDAKISIRLTKPVFKI